MASEISVEYLSGYTLYFVVENAAAQRWYTVTPFFETHDAAHWTDYDIALSEQTSSGTYIGSFPSGITTAGRYRVTVYQQLGGSPAIGDLKIGSSTIDWDGSAEVGVNDSAIVLAKLNASVVQVSGPVAPDGSLPIVQGDDYRTADGRALSWTIADWSGPDVDDIQIELRLVKRANYEAGAAAAEQTIAGAIAMAGADALVSVDLTSAQSAALEAVSWPVKHNYVYQLVAIDVDDHEITLRLGPATITQRVVP